jgi:ribosomal protein S18 acetylase RimI-like enzyme
VTTIRRATATDIEGIVHVHIESWRENFERFLAPSQIKLKNLVYEDQFRIWQARFAKEEGQSRYTFIALDDLSHYAGYISGRKNGTENSDYDAELHQIYIIPRTQQQGLGKRLVNNLSQQLHQADYQSLIVWVMPMNPAVRFYRDGLKGNYLGERIIPDGDGELKEAAYGWPDIRTLLTPKKESIL